MTLQRWLSIFSKINDSPPNNEKKDTVNIKLQQKRFDTEEEASPSE